MGTSKARMKYDQRFESVSRVHKIPEQLVKMIYLTSNYPQRDVLIHFAKKIYEIERNQHNILSFLDGLTRTVAVGSGLSRKYIRKEFVMNENGKDAEIDTLNIIVENMENESEEKETKS